MQKSKQNSPLDETVDKLVHGYDTMMEKLYEWVEKSDENSGQLFIQGMDDAEKFMHDLGDWTKEEVALISDYIKRDLHHIAEKYESPRQKLSEWLQIDGHEVEQKVLDLLSFMADRTRLELDHLRHLAERSQELHTGEITSIGIQLQNVRRGGPKHESNEARSLPNSFRASKHETEGREFQDSSVLRASGRMGSFLVSF